MPDEFDLNDLGSDDPPDDTDAILPLDDERPVLATEAPAQPLNLATIAHRAPDRRTAIAIQELRGFRASADWLPAHLSDELDALRDRQRELVVEAGSLLGDLHDFKVKFRDEDNAHAEGQRQAVRDGQPVEDERTPDFDRYRAVEGVEEQLWPRIVVLAEVCTEAIRVIQQQEPEIVAGVAERMFEAESKAQEAQRLMAEHRATAWEADRLARGVLSTGENSVLSSQPRPMQEPAPGHFEPGAATTSRAWWARDRVVPA